MSKKMWKPLPPGTHEYDGGNVIIDGDGFITRTYAMSMRGIVEGVSGVPPMPFRLCHLVPADAPDAPDAMTVRMTPDVREAIGRLMHLWWIRHGPNATYTMVEAWLDSLEEGNDGTPTG